VRDKEALDAARTIREFPDAGVRILKGRFGPYATDAGRRASIPKDRDPASVTLEEALKLLEEAPAKKGARKKKAATKKKPAAKKTAAKKAPAKKKAKKKSGKKAGAKKKPPAKKEGKPLPEREPEE
jgi:DNA topoisomerase-1